GRAAVAIEPDDAWGCHAVAHALGARGRTDDGIAWLRSQNERFAGIGNFARHLAWHEALLVLAGGNRHVVLALYDRRIRDQPTDDYRDIANAASLLWRLERAGIAVGRRWEELADLAERRIEDGALAFAQLHYMLCLAGAGRWRKAASLLAAMTARVREGAGTQAEVLAQVGVP